MENCLLTIFTPTFNRTDKIKKLANSLMLQTSNRFCWLIVDDGSYTDETRKYIYTLSNANFKITYIKIPNGGKYNAYNFAIDRAKTEYFCCVDDDDVVNINFVEIVLKYISILQPEIGIVFPRNKAINIDIKKVDLTALWHVYGIKIETIVVLKLLIAKKNKFPFFSNEKFASEEIIYNKISDIGKFDFVNYPICTSEYMEDGLTNKLFLLWRNNPLSSYYLFNSRYNFFKKTCLRKRVLLRVKCLSNYYSVLAFNKNKPKFKLIGNFLYQPLCFFLGFFVYLKKKKRLKEKYTGYKS